MAHSIGLIDKDYKMLDVFPAGLLSLIQTSGGWQDIDPITHHKCTYIIDEGGEGKRVYISGAVTGLPYEEAERVFTEAETKLLAEGYDAVNPVKFGLNDGWEWKDYMARDLEILKSCEAIYLLDGWEQSHGARTEYEFALGMGIEIMYQNGERQNN